jgi:hypothetical protein
VDRQAFRVAHVRQVAEQLQPVDETLARFPPALNSKSQDRPGSFRQVFSGCGVIWVTGQSRIGNPAHARVRV